MIRPRLEIGFSFRRQLLYCFGPKVSPNVDSRWMVNHARTGIALALQSLNLPKGAGVGMLCYNCKSVMTAIASCGYQIVFIDVTDRLTVDYDDLKKKSEHLSAFVVSHLFGLPSDVDAIRQILPDVPIIEDCAHAYGSVGIGIKGDFAVYSIGMGKFPSIGDGGILHVNNLAYKDKIDALYRRLPCYSWKDKASLFFKMETKSCLYTPWVYRYVTLPFLKTKGKVKIDQQLSKRRMAVGIQRIYDDLLPEMEEKIARRKRQCASVASELIEKGYSPIYDSRANGFMLPVCCDNPTALKKIIWNTKGLETATHFHQCIQWAKAFGYVEGGCSNTERLVDHLLMIPTYTMSE